MTLSIAKIKSRQNGKVSSQVFNTAIKDNLGLALFLI